MSEQTHNTTAAAVKLRKEHGGDDRALCRGSRLPLVVCVSASVNPDTDASLESLTVFCGLMFTRVDADRLPLSLPPLAALRGAIV